MPVYKKFQDEKLISEEGEAFLNCFDIVLFYGLHFCVIYEKLVHIEMYNLVHLVKIYIPLRIAF